MNRWIAISVLLLVPVLAGCPFGPGPGPFSFTIDFVQLDFIEPKGNPLNDLDWVAGAVDLGSGNVSTAVWMYDGLNFVQDGFNVGMLNGINNRGAVVGRRRAEDDDPIQFVNFLDSNHDPTRTRSGIFYSVNEFDEIAGWSPSRPGSATLDQVFGTENYIFQGPNGDPAIGYGINDLRDLVGSSTNEDGDPFTSAQLWMRGARYPLGSLGGPFSEAYAINNSGVTVGVSTEAPEGKAVLPHVAVHWDGATALALPGLGGSESTAWDVNSSGEIAGYATNASEESRAVLWIPTDDSEEYEVVDLNYVVDLGDLEPDSLILRDALDVNEVGSVVSRADMVDGNSVIEVHVLLLRE